MLEAKRRAAVFFILAFILAAATGYMVLQKVKDLNSDLGAMTKVYVAKADIPSRTVIQEKQVTVMELPNKFITESHITSFQDLENQVSVVPLTEGDMITQNMIKPASNLQNENNRLVTLHRTDKIQFDQVIEALDRVDIIVSTNNNGKRSTSVFMKDVVVRFSQGTGDKFAGVAVEVTADEAPKLIHMQNYADHIRILKANVGQNSLPAEENNEQATKDKAPAETKTEEKTVEQKEADKKATTKESSTKEAPTKETTPSDSGQ